MVLAGSAVFLVNVPVAALAFFLALRYVPESRDPNPGSFDLAGAALSIVALSTFVYGIIEAPGRGWLDPVTLGCFGAAALVAVAFVVWELRAPRADARSLLLQGAALRRRLGRDQPRVLLPLRGGVRD